MFVLELRIDKGYRCVVCHTHTFDDNNDSFTNLNALRIHLDNDGLHQLINSPTRYTATKSTCLDLIFTNFNIIQDTGVADVNFSDPQMIVFARKKTKSKTTKCNFIGRSYRNYNKIIFQSLVQE